MATVKGDVHDIGKNIVGVVLACNNYEIIDLGVMVSAETILNTAREVGADLIGLSGLITPSLEEMVHVAREMERQEMKLPLLIGGATTSKAHTAVKIAPAYSQPVVHVLDASRAVSVASQLKSPEQREGFAARNRTEQEKLRREHQEKRSLKPLLSLAEARRRRTAIDWTAYDIPRPSFTGVRSLDDVALAEIVPFIDWSPFFAAWELQGTYPRIFDHPEWGERARELYDDAREELRALVTGGRLRASAVYGFFPANAVGDDVEVYTDETRGGLRTTFHFLRQQMDKGPAEPNQCPRRLRGSARARPHRLAGRLRGDRRPGHRRPRGRGGGFPRRLPVDPDQGPRRPPGRGPHREAASAGPRGLGLRPRRVAAIGRAHPRALPGHPARSRLSGLSRPHREGTALRPPRGAAGSA